MSQEMLSILMFITLLFSVTLGHPLAFTLGGLAVIFGVIGWGPGSLHMIANRTYGLMTNYVLVAVPLFVFMAQLLDKTGIAEDLFESMYIVMGSVKGGLAIATIIVATIFAATTGIVGASVVAMGLLAGPTMLKKGYKKELVAGVITAGGTLGILIPPSIMLVIYAGIIGESVGKLFLGAFMPGFLLSGLYIVYTALLCKIKPAYGPPIPKEDRTHTFGQKFNMVFKSTIPPLFLILAVLGSIAFGIATPTEAAGLGCLGAMVLAIFHKKLDLKSLYQSSLATVKVTSMVMVLFIGANAFTSVFMALGGGDVFTNLLLNVSSNKWVILGLMNLILILLGCFVDWLGILLLCVPIFTPIAEQLGFDPLWIALLFCVNLQSSFLTPPFGYALFYLKGINLEGMTTKHIYKGVIPFIFIQILAVVLCIIFPEIITWLPNKILK